MQRPFSIGVLTGGPSLERGISLNSARSLLDHLASPTVRVVPIYFDQKRHAYRLSEAQLYSNTPADFDFQVQRLAKALTPKQLIAELKRCDLVFPAIHGAFGEDGEIQTVLEAVRSSRVFEGSVDSSLISIFLSCGVQPPQDYCVGGSPALIAETLSTPAILQIG